MYVTKVVVPLDNLFVTSPNTLKKLRTVLEWPFFASRLDYWMPCTFCSRTTSQIGKLASYLTLLAWYHLTFWIRDGQAVGLQRWFGCNFQDDLLVLKKQFGCENGVDRSTWPLQLRKMNESYRIIHQLSVGFPKMFRHYALWPWNPGMDVVALSGEQLLGSPVRRKSRGWMRSDTLW